MTPVTPLEGTFGASPFGLSINPTTGAININKSETGLNYKVFYVKTGSKDTCTFNLTVAGIDFPSSLYFMGQDNMVVKPIYNGVPSSLVGTDNVSFDIASLAGMTSLQSMGINIDPATALIDLKKTMASGVLGVKPVSGTSVIVRLYYKINDASQGALNHVDIRFSYYSKVSEVPASLMNKISTTVTQSAGARSSADAAADGGGNKARPPDIVIVG